MEEEVEGFAEQTGYEGAGSRVGKSGQTPAAWEIGEMVALPDDG